MSNRFLIERMRRGMAGIYIPDPGGVGLTPTAVMATQGDASGAGPANPNNPPLSVLQRQQQLNYYPLGRNMTFEESIGHLLWKRRRTADGGNHLAPNMPKEPFRVRRAPWLDLPAGGEAYVKMNPQAVMIGAIGSVTIVAAFQVPQRKNGNIEWIANQFIGGQGVEGTGVIKWQILLDGVPAKNYNDIPATIGTMSNPADLRESPIRIFENQQIKLVCVNVAFNPNQQVLLGMLRGKFWPIEQEGPNTWV